MEEFKRLTTGICEQAFDLVLPAIEPGMSGDDPAFGGDAGHLVVLDPTVRYEVGVAAGPTDEAFGSRVVLFAQDLGEPDPAGEIPFAEMALEKAYISWKTGRASHLVAQEAPYLFEPGINHWGGSSVGPGGIVVAVAGTHVYFDQLIGEMMIAAIRALCLQAISEELIDFWKSI